MTMLDAFLKDRNNEWYSKMGVDEEKLKSGLRQITSYEWGGDQENSLDQYLVRRYIKVISDYDVLKSKANVIAANAWKFVQTSWYNNWTSYIIESFFKQNPRVISAVGEIKSVDFFIDDYPIDLKVTYFPDGYMQTMLKKKLGHKEITWLKQKAKKAGIPLDKNLTDSEQYNYIIEELGNKGHREVVEELYMKRKEIVEQTYKDPIPLIKWLYENQSKRLFGAENRIFVILVDSIDMNQSWKMKRAFSLIEPKVKDYLQQFNSNSLKNIEFIFNHNKYRCLADTIFIIKK